MDWLKREKFWCLGAICFGGFVIAQSEFVIDLTNIERLGYSFIKVDCIHVQEKVTLQWSCVLFWEHGVLLYFTELEGKFTALYFCYFAKSVTILLVSCKALVVYLGTSFTFIIWFFTLSESLSAWFYIPPQLLDVYRYRILWPYFVLFQFFVFLIMLMKHKTIFWIIFSSLCFQKLVFIITSLEAPLESLKKQFPLGYLEHKYTKTNFKTQ